MSFLSEHDYYFIYSKVPRVCVDLLLQTSEGILLAKRDIPPYLGYWHLPGGRIQMRETAEDAVKRIAKTELNLKVKTDALIGHIDYLEERVPGYSLHSISLVFKVKIDSGELKGNEQSREVKFFPKIPQQLIPEQLAFLKKEYKIRE